MAVSPHIDTEIFELEEKVGRLLASQRAFIFGPEKFAMIAGGFGSGKTRAGVTKGLILSAIFPGNRGIIGRYHGTDLEDSTKPVFFEVCPPSWIKSYNKQNNTVILRNGSQIYFRHIHDPKSKSATKTRRLGANLGWFFIDQAEEIGIEHWNAMISRLRYPKVPKHFGFGAMNPNGHDWIWKTFFPTYRPWAPGEFHQVIRSRHNFLGVAVNSEENRASRGGFVDDDYFDSMLENYPPEWIERYIRCSFDDFTGKIYRDYQAGLEDPRYASVHNIEPFPIPRHWELIVGIDVGGDSPWAVVPEYIDDWGNTVVVPGLVKASVNVREIADWIKDNLPWDENRTRYVIDPENKIAMIELAEYGIHCVPATKSLLPGILRVGGYFHVRKGLALPPWYEETQPQEQWLKFMDQGSPRTFVFNTFEEYRRDHDSYVWDEKKKNTPKKTDTMRYDTCDADRYVKMMRPEASKLKDMPNEKRHAYLLQVDPLSAKAFEQLDKRIADRIYRQRGGNALTEADMEEIPMVSQPSDGKWEYDA